MTQKLTIFLSALLVFLFWNCSIATTRKVLFIGNSYTYTNNMPNMLDTMAAAMGDTLLFDMAASGGFDFAQHCTDPATITKIFSQQWDVVVLQDQSEEPAFPPDQVDTQVYPYATRLDSMVRANDSCTQTMFMMTWGHANGDPLNCGFYPAICTYDGMQERLRESYLQMGVTNHACVAPVGSAFKIMMDSMYTPWLYMSDSDHPVVPGSYLEAAVMYSSIFHKGTLNCSYTAGIPGAEVHNLQRIATMVVFDSLSQWQQNGHYPYAGFGYSKSGSTVSFTSYSPVLASYSWSFGDHATSTDANPVHIYTAMGTYVVSNTAYNNCFTETLSDTLVISTTGVQQVNSAATLTTTSALGNGRLLILLPAQVGGQLEIYNCNGSLVRRYDALENRIEDKFTPGFYFFRWRDPSIDKVQTGKIVVY